MGSGGDSLHSSFFPGHSFPLDLVLRVDRSMAMIIFQGKDLSHWECLFQALCLCSVRQLVFWRGTKKTYWVLFQDEIAYISSVAFRESFTRKGIAKRLIWTAEALDKNWQCRAIGLHCDLLNNLGATKLYKDQGYRCIRIPEGANWPQPKTSPDTRFKTSWWSSWTTTVHKSLNSFGKSKAKGKVEFYLLMK